jgi:hypothetical protein
MCPRSAGPLPHQERNDLDHDSLTTRRSLLPAREPANLYYSTVFLWFQNQDLTAQVAFVARAAIAALPGITCFRTDVLLPHQERNQLEFLFAGDFQSSKSSPDFNGLPDRHPMTTRLKASLSL